MALTECETRALVAAVYDAYGTGEKTLARQLIGRLGEGMLCLADRTFACWELWHDAAATGAELLWRVERRSPCPSMRSCRTARTCPG